VEPEQAMVMDPAMQGAGPMEAPEMDQDAMLGMLLQQLVGGWSQKEMEVDSQKQALMEMVMQMLASQQPAADPLQGYAEGSQGPVAGVAE